MSWRDQPCSFKCTARHLRHSSPSAGRSGISIPQFYAARRVTFFAQRSVTGHRRRDFFGRKPVLMVVEPESLCWLTGRMVQTRDGATWAEEFARFPALEAVVRDDGTGLGKGVRLERARRRAEGLPDLDDTLDVFLTLREVG